MVTCGRVAFSTPAKDSRPRTIQRLFGARFIAASQREEEGEYTSASCRHCSIRHSYRHAALGRKTARFKPQETRRPISAGGLRKTDKRCMCTASSNNTGFSVVFT